MVNGAAVSEVGLAGPGRSPPLYRQASLDPIDLPNWFGVQHVNTYFHFKTFFFLC